MTTMRTAGSQVPLLNLAIMACRDTKSIPMTVRLAVVDAILAADGLDLELIDQWGHSAGHVAVLLYSFLDGAAAAAAPKVNVAVAILGQLLDRGHDILAR